MSLIHFLLVYDLKAQQLLSHDEFTDGREAVQAYSDCELKHRGDSDIEIVLVGADSLDTIRVTHGQYFDGEPAASPYLAGV
jgi:hypothetical protein